MAGSPPALPAARFLLPLLAILLVGLAGLPVAGGEAAAAAAAATKMTKVLWMGSEAAFNQQARHKRRPHCLIGVVRKKSRRCHLHLGARKWKPRRAAFQHYPCACASLRKQLTPYVQNRLCHHALASHRSFARGWPSALVIWDSSLQAWPKWHPAHYSKARNRRWWYSGQRRYPRTALDHSSSSSLGATPPLSAAPTQHLGGAEPFRPLGPTKGPLPNMTASFGYSSQLSRPSGTGTTPPARCQCPGGERNQGEDRQQKALKGPQAGRRVPTPRTEEAAWAASALTFLLVVLTFAVLYTQLYRKCRRGRSLYWPTGSEEGHDTVAALRNVNARQSTAALRNLFFTAAIIKHRLLSVQARRKKRPRKQQQRMPLLPATSSESSE